MDNRLIPLILTRAEYAFVPSEASESIVSLQILKDFDCVQGLIFWLDKLILNSRDRPNGGRNGRARQRSDQQNNVASANAIWPPSAHRENRDLRESRKSGSISADSQELCSLRWI